MENENKENITIEQQIVQILNKNKLIIASAESCTGGLIASTIINASGASNVIKESYITYSNEAKIKILKVNPSTIDKYSVYSKEVAREMVMGLYLVSHANVCISVTGLAGGSIKERGLGSCDFAIYINKDNIDILYEEHYENYGTRNEVRRNQVEHILQRVKGFLDKYFEV